MEKRPNRARPAGETPRQPRIPAALAAVFLILLSLFPAGAARGESWLGLSGGNQTSVEAWPATVALFTHGAPDSLDSQFCGGTLVAPLWVVTAAHCTKGRAAAQIDAVTGRTDLSTSQGQRIQVQAIYEHPAHDSNTEEADLALLRLASASAQPSLGLIPRDDPQGLAAPGTQGVTVGWGDTVQGSGLGSAILAQVMAPVLDSAVANQADWYNGWVLPHMFAAGFAEGGRDACRGDSGGPYMVPDGSGGYLLAGVVSWGVGCAQPKRPGVYTRLSSFRGWIDGVMGVGTADGSSSGGTATPVRVVPALDWAGAAALAGVLALSGLGRCGRNRSRPGRPATAADRASPSPDPRGGAA